MTTPPDHDDAPDDPDASSTPPETAETSDADTSDAVIRDTAGTGETDGGDDPDTSDGPSAGTPRWLLTLVAVIAVGALVVGALLVWMDRNDLANEIADREDVEETAVAFTSAILTYDYTDLDAIEGRIDGLATPPLLEEYGSGLDESLRGLLVEAEATSTVQILGVYSSEVVGDIATVIVLAQTDVSSTTASRAQVTSHIQLDMVQVDGQWLVNELTTLTNQGQALDADGQPIGVPGADGPGPSASSTTAPDVGSADTSTPDSAPTDSAGG